MPCVSDAPGKSVSPTLQHAAAREPPCSLRRAKYHRDGKVALTMGRDDSGDWFVPVHRVLTDFAFLTLFTFNVGV